MKRFRYGTIPVELFFLRYFYLFLAIFTSLQINSAIVCLLVAVNMARFGNVNANKFNLVVSFYVQNEMLCTKHIIVLFPWNNFPIVFVWRDIKKNVVLSSLARTLYLTNQHNRKTVPSGGDNNRILLNIVILEM